MPIFNPVRALERGLKILQTINQNDGLKAQNIAEVTSIPRPTVYRLLETLETQGFVVQSRTNHTWHSTLKCSTLSSGFLDKAWVGQIAMPEMINLGRKILWPIDLITFADYAMQVRETTHKFSPFSFDQGMVGKCVPMLHTAGGRAYLAYCPEKERAAILDVMRKSDLPEHALAKETKIINQIIAQTLSDGYGHRIDGYRSHTVSVSVPVFQRKKVMACLTVICLKSAITFDEMVKEHVPLLRRTCQTISAKFDNNEVD